MTSTLPDRRAALKARHRAAILAAAEALIDELGGPNFGVELLAARADVARRTVFNHFASLDDVLLTVCTEALTVIVDDFVVSVARTTAGDGSRRDMLDELAAAVHESDLPTAIAGMVRITGGVESGSAREADLTLAAFSRVSDRLQLAVAHRHPGADRLDIDLLVGSLMSGVATIAKHWVDRTSAHVDDGSRALWDELVARLLRSLRSGYMPT